MFDGLPADQLHQFITPRTSLPLHLSFPLQPNSLHPFDPYNPSSHQLQLPLQPNFLHPLHHHKDEEKEENSTRVSMNFGNIERDQRQLPDDQQLIDSWTNDEVLALLRIRSSMESWFPELTWEHVSRKLAELGYKRSGDKCKEKFEEESRYFNNINNNYGKNCRFVSELEELYQSDPQNPPDLVEKQPSEGQDKIMEEDLRKIDDTSVTKQCEEISEKVVEKSKERKRKRPDHRFEMFKGFCERIVHKLMAQQEEMHNKLLEDMLKIDEDKFRREEAWKKHEMDRMNKELELMAQEQATAGDRQVTIIEFLKKFAATGSGNQCKVLEVTNATSNSNSNTRTIISSSMHTQNPNPSIGDNSTLELEPIPSTVILNNQKTGNYDNPSSSLGQDTLQVASSSTTSAPPHNPSPSCLNNIPLEANSVVSNFTASSNRVTTTENSKDDVGRRWPRDEVLALINLRCTSVNNNNNEDHKEGNNKTPMWERISQGMSELGYKRSAKRCKEKWENINKYFRKTKDVNKKRSLDSRTCPYFHQLSNLYSQGKLAMPENHLNPPPAKPPGQLPKSSHEVAGSGGFSMHMHVDHGGGKTLMQVPSLDFDDQF